jgi:hypothetical protein
MSKTTLEQLRAALHGRMEVRRYPFPGQPEITVGIKLLTDDEQDGVRLRAQHEAVRVKANILLDPEYLNRLIHRETVALACYGEGDQFLFEDAAQVAKELDALTVAALYDLYIFHHQALDPYSFADEEEVKALVDQLGKSETDVGRLSLFDAPTLRIFVLILVARLRANSAAPSSSTG